VPSMRPVLLTSLALAGLLAAASPAVAASNVETTVTTLTAPQTMPILFAGSADIYGHRVDQGAPIPAGSAALKVSFTPQAKQDTLVSATCPAGSGAADMGEGAGVPPMGGGFASPFGENVTQFRFEPPAPSGVVDLYVLCLPIAKGTSKVVASHSAPVTFRSGDPSLKTIKKGAHLKANQTLLRTTLTGLTKGQAALTVVTCPKRLVAFYGAFATKGFSGMISSDTFGIQPPARSGSATLYTVCQAPIGF
jgi:hypothetical protein